AGYLDLAKRNAALALASRVDSHSAQRARLEALQELLGMDEPPQRIECFDISHTMGEATVASCVVFDGEGPVRSQYRRYNITGVAPGDDYAAMGQALMRRFRRAAEEGGVVPDVLLIDGGAGQVRQAREVLAEAGVADVAIVGVAKGPERRPGEETLLLPDGREVRPGPGAPGPQRTHRGRGQARRGAAPGHRGRRQ